MSYNLDPQIFKSLSNNAITGKSVNWGFIERICITFDDTLEIIQHCIKLGVSVNGIPERTEKFLKSKGINLRDLQ